MTHDDIGGNPWNERPIPEKIFRPADRRLMQSVLSKDLRRFGSFSLNHIKRLSKQHALFFLKSSLAPVPPPPPPLSKCVCSPPPNQQHLHMYVSYITYAEFAPWGEPHDKAVFAKPPSSPNRTDLVTICSITKQTQGEIYIHKRARARGESI